MSHHKPKTKTIEISIQDSSGACNGLYKQFGMTLHLAFLQSIRLSQKCMHIMFHMRPIKMLMQDVICILHPKMTH